MASSRRVYPVRIVDEDTEDTGVHTLESQFSRIALDDDIDVLIRTKLSDDLEGLEKYRKLTEVHPCFRLAREFCQKYGISDLAFKNFVRLACGNLNFPILMLLNPCSNHKTKGFDEMIRKSATLRWIQEALKKIGLDLEDVIIFDACPLLDDKSLEKMDNATRLTAMSDAYDLTWKMLEILRPNIIVACHCNPSGPLWEGIAHIAKEKLASTIRGANKGEVKKIDINGHDLHVVQAYHPSRKTKEMKERLEKILHRVYAPCAAWKKNHRIALRGLIDAIDSLTNAVIEHTRASNRSTSYLIHLPQRRRDIEAVH